MENADLPVLRLLREHLDAPREDEAAFRTSLLAAVGGTLGWVIGTLWLPDASATRLEIGGTWTARWHEGSSFLDAARTQHPARGEGLPGRVWASAEPMWLNDVTVDPHFRRVDAAREEGLHSGIGIPLVASDGAVVGVLEFFTDQFRSPLPLMLDLFREIGRVAAAAFDRRADAAS